MKTTTLLITAAVVLGFTPGFLMAADSKRTAEYVLATPADYEGKEITLDVGFVKPVQWKSPLPEIAFFHAMTIDRNDKKPGGHILVAIPSGDAASFVKKYGMDFDGRNDYDTPRGLFMAAPGKGRGMHGRVWLVDTTGKLRELIEQKKIEIDDSDDESAEGGSKFPGFRGGPGGRKNAE